MNTHDFCDFGNRDFGNSVIEVRIEAKYPEGQIIQFY